MNGQQGGDPAKLAAALVTITELDDPPLRFVAGADAVAAVEQKAHDLLAQIDAHRDLSTNLAHDAGMTGRPHASRRRRRGQHSQPGVAATRPNGDFYRLGPVEAPEEHRLTTVEGPRPILPSTRASAVAGDAHTVSWSPTLLSEAVSTPLIDASSLDDAKLALLTSLFGARSDVYATRWENASTGRAGWSPATRGRWSRHRSRQDHLPLTDDVFRVSGGARLHGPPTHTLSLNSTTAQ